MVMMKQEGSACILIQLRRIQALKKFRAFLVLREKNENGN
jgi:hypothetical protein